MAKGSSAAHVLLVDDDAEVVESVSAALTTLGYEVRTAASVEAAVASTKEDVPELVIIDVGLPGGSGYELLREIRSGLGDVPVIFLSADRTEPQDRVAGLLAGGDDYLVKPVDPEELAARVRAVLRRTST